MRGRLVVSVGAISTMFWLFLDAGAITNEAQPGAPRAIAARCAPVPAGLTAWWPAEGDATDIAGGRNGVLVGDTAFAPGMVGQAFDFDGLGDYVRVADDPELTFGDNPFTIDAWVYFRNIVGRGVTFAAHNEGPGTQNKWTFWFENLGHRAPFGPGVRLVVDGPGINAQDLAAYLWSPILQTWYHVAVTRDSSGFSLYIDGLLVSTDQASVTFPDPAAPLTIGWSEGPFFFDGLIDEVEIFDRALSEEEIRSIFEAGSSGKCFVTSVDIDIKPGSFPNSINIKSKGVIPVAILSTGGFDATEVDAATVRFGPAEAPKAHDKPLGHFEDVDGDGTTDLLLHFRTRDTGISCGDTTAVLTGELLGGQPISGADTIRIASCE